MIDTLCLGTAQLGLDRYGLANRSGKPDDEEMTAMLDAAIGAGVQWIDTAAAYGDAEERLGRYGVPSRVRIITKLRPNLFDGEPVDITRTILDEFNASYRRLRRKPDVYLLHSARYVFRDDILRSLRAVPVEHVGVSCYEPEEVRRAVEAGLDAVEVPYSILDQRCESAMARAKARGLMVFARAPFVQGLVFLDGDAIPDRLAHARPHVARLRQCFGPHDEQVAEAALAFVRHCPWVDAIVFGAETREQVVANLLVVRDSCWGGQIWSAGRRDFKNIPEAVVNPSLWANPVEAS